MKARSHLPLLFLCSTLLALSAPNSPAEYKVLLRITGVQGESTIARHEGDIDALSFQHGQSVPYSQPGGAGRVTFSELSVLKYVDKASPNLMYKCARGEHIPTAVLFVLSQGNPAVEFYKVTLNDVMILSVNVAGDARGSDAKPVESLTLSFGRIEWEYVPQRPDGTLDSPIRRYWEVNGNTGG